MELQQVLLEVSVPAETCSKNIIWANVAYRRAFVKFVCLYELIFKEHKYLLANPLSQRVMVGLLLYFDDFLLMLLK